MKRVLIGIPAYNEEQNIKNLISDILKQKINGYILDRIIVNNDASDDNTAKIVGEIRGSKVELIDNNSRGGVAVRQNQIFDYADQDIVVLLNADIRIEDDEFLNKLIAPIIKGKADLVAANMIEVVPSNIIEKALYVSTKIKEDVFSDYKYANNVFTCHGPARAFSRELYSKLRFRYGVGEDAYSYFYTKLYGMKYEYRKNAKIVYKLPHDLADHINQSKRFIKSKQLMINIFGELARHEYEFPKRLFVKSVLKHLILYPLETVIYLGIYFYVNIFVKEEIDNFTWSSVSTTKLVK